MPIFSLPSKEGIGTLGEGAYNFVNFLQRANAKIWQVLPLNPTGYGNSPYQSCSSNSLNYFLIDLHILCDEGLLTEQEIAFADLIGENNRIDYSKQITNKINLLKTAFNRFDLQSKDFNNFVKSGEYFDFAIFMALKERFNFSSWKEWAQPYKTYNADYIKFYVEESQTEFLFWQFTQFMFLKQWNALKKYANQRGVKIMGDIPLYLSHDSVEMWKMGNAIFSVDENREPNLVAGAPPDDFCEDGQLWGNPLYDWEKMKKDGYIWWNERIKRAFNLFDILRVDHFRGFDRYYAIPKQSANAKYGKWLDGPKEEFFADKLSLNIVAEDLGVLDEGVYRLMKNLGYPGMKILQFAFDGDKNNEHKPSKITQNFVCYTGTHDNATLVEYINGLSDEEYKIFCADLIDECGKLQASCDISSPESIAQTVMGLAFKCKANTVIIPMWDLLCLGKEGRINTPSSVDANNWTWRVQNSNLSAHMAQLFKKLNDLGQRNN